MPKASRLRFKGNATIALGAPHYIGEPHIGAGALALFGLGARSRRLTFMAAARFRFVEIIWHPVSL